jgi:hypothetical protein
MERVAVFVDAGYLFAQGSVALTGTKQSREYLALRIADVLAALVSIREQIESLESVTGLTLNLLNPLPF